MEFIPKLVIDYNVIKWKPLDQGPIGIHRVIIYTIKNTLIIC